MSFPKQVGAINAVHISLLSIATPAEKAAANLAGIQAAQDIARKAAEKARAEELAALQEAEATYEAFRLKRSNDAVAIQEAAETIIKARHKAAWLAANAEEAAADIAAKAAAEARAEAHATGMARMFSKTVEQAQEASAAVSAALSRVGREAAAVTPSLSRHLQEQAALIESFMQNSLVGGYLTQYTSILQWQKINPFASAAMKAEAARALETLKDIIRRFGGAQGRQIDFAALGRQKTTQGSPSMLVTMGIIK